MNVVAARDSATFRLPFYYGWVNVVLAAIAMAATLPGRTHGLGLITEPLLRDLQLDLGVMPNSGGCSAFVSARLCHRPVVAHSDLRLFNARRVVVLYERFRDRFFGFVLLDYLLIRLRQFLNPSAVSYFRRAIAEFTRIQRFTGNDWKSGDFSHDGCVEQFGI